MSTPTIAAIALACAAASAQGRTWTVDASGGPGVDFADIPPAVAKAVAGDRIVVRGNSTYSSFVLTEGLEIEARQGARTPRIHVDRIGPAETAGLSGLRADHLRVTSCRGPIVLASLRVTSASGTAARIEGCHSVLVHDCAFTGARGGDGLVLLDSNAALRGGKAVGGAGERRCSAGTCRNTAGGAGVRSLRSRLSANHTWITGGRGAAAHRGAACLAGSNGGNAIDATGGWALVRGTATLEAGAGGKAEATCRGGAPGMAVQGSVQVGGAARVIGRLGAGARRLHRMPTVRAPAEVRLGAAADVNFTGTPGATMFVALDLFFCFATDPAIRTPFFMTRAAILPAAKLTVSATGTAKMTLPIPPLSVLRGRAVLIQGIHVRPGIFPVDLTGVALLRVR